MLLLFLARDLILSCFVGNIIYVHIMGIMVLCIRHGLVRLSFFPSLCSHSKLTLPKRSKSHSHQASGNCFDFEDFEGGAFFWRFSSFPSAPDAQWMLSGLGTIHVHQVVGQPRGLLGARDVSRRAFRGPIGWLRFELWRSLKIFEDLWRGSYMIIHDHNDASLRPWRWCKFTKYVVPTSNNDSWTSHWIKTPTGYNQIDRIVPKYNKHQQTLQNMVCAVVFACGCHFPFLGGQWWTSLWWTWKGLALSPSRQLRRWGLATKRTKRCFPSARNCGIDSKYSNLNL